MQVKYIYMYLFINITILLHIHVHVPIYKYIPHKSNESITLLKTKFCTSYTDYWKMQIYMQCRGIFDEISDCFKFHI